MAFLKKRGQVWYLVHQEGPRKVWRRISTNREIARERLRRFEEEQDRARAGLGAGDRWLSECSEAHFRRLQARVGAGDLAQASAVRAREALTYFLTWLQEKHPRIRRLGQVSREVLTDYQLARAGRVRAKTVNTELSLISPMFRQAVRDGSLRVSPFDGLRKLKERDSTPAKQLSPAQVLRLLKKAKKEDPDLYPYLAGYVYTGARRGELFEVTWKQVDEAAGILQVPNLKTSRSPADAYRPVPIHPELAKVLRKLRKLERPWPRLPGESFRRRYHRITKAAEMPWLTRLHDLRHAFAGALVSSGVELYTVGELLGHRDPRTTKRYSRLRPEALMDAVGKLNFNR